MIHVNALHYDGEDVGAKLNNAMQAFGTDPANIVLPQMGTVNYSNTIYLMPDKIIDFGGNNLEYTGNHWAMVTDPNYPCLRTVIMNCNIRSRGELHRDLVCLTGFRSGALINVRLAKNNQPTKNIALLKLRSKDEGFGCHTNYFERVYLFCNELINGMIIRQSGTQSCNANLFTFFHVTFAKEVGIQVETGTGNVFNMPIFEKCPKAWDNKVSVIVNNPYYEKCGGML